MNSPVQQIKERLSIEEVVSSYIKLEKVGSNLKAATTASEDPPAPCPAMLVPIPRTPPPARPWGPFRRSRLYACANHSA